MDGEVIEGEIVKQSWYNKFTDKHGSFYSSLWDKSLTLGFLYAFLKWLSLVVEMIQIGNVAGVFFTFIFQTIIMALNGIFSALFIFVFLSILLTIPYFIYRGVVK